MFSETVQQIFNVAFQEAKNRKHEYIVSEHILYALLFDKNVVEFINECGGNINLLKKDTLNYLDAEVTSTPKNVSYEPTETKSIKRIQQRIMHNTQRFSREAETCDILFAIYREDSSHASFFLKSQNVNNMKLVNMMRRFSEKMEETDTENRKSGAKIKSKILENYVVDITHSAQEDKIDTLIGRNEEITRLTQILCRRKKNNPILIGEPGVGKTAIVEGLALKIINNSVPEIIQGSKIFSLDIGKILAGTKYRGSFEMRTKLLIKEIQKYEKSILFIDEIHTIIKAGSASGSVVDIANLLKPLLADGKLRCIGATTYQEYRNVFQKDAALSRRFQKINVVEPTVKETVNILRGIKTKYEQHYNINYYDSAITAAAELSNKYIHERYLPDKAIDIIDEVGAANVLLPKVKRKKFINTRDIEKIVSSITQIPIYEKEKDILLFKNLKTKLQHKIFGQDHAIDSVVTAIIRNKVGIGNNKKPIGCFLFTGPSGVGKTELSKQIACVLDLPFKRFDMSEYIEKHSVARFIGAPPGYVGFEQRGLLTDAIFKTPYCVILLDEIEKAHYQVLNVLLQIMDYGKLTDNTGTQADFCNAIIIMTSNIGSQEKKGQVIGFENTYNTQEQDAIMKNFSTEFRNRLDDIIVFNSLNKTVISNIVNKEIQELQKVLQKKNVSLLLQEPVKEAIVKKCIDNQYGARILHRVIQIDIQNIIAQEMLFGKLMKGGKVIVGYKNSKLFFQYN